MTARIRIADTNIIIIQSHQIEELFWGWKTLNIIQQNLTKKETDTWGLITWKTT